MSTGNVRPGSDLERRRWTTDKLGKQAAMSFWNAYTGTSSASVIYAVNDGGCSSGHTIIFDYSGKLTGSGVRGHESGCAIGETKRKFSDSLTVEMFSFYVDNGSKFNACNIGDLSISEHSDSMAKLADLWIRHKDQAIFDTLQGAAGDCSLSHVYNLGCSFEFNDLAYIENAAKKGSDLVKTANGIVTTTPAVKRAPLEGYRLSDGTPVYLAVIDNVMATRLKANPKYQTIMINADVRGARNALISGVIGKASNVVYVEAPVFYGTTKKKGPFDIISDSTIQFSGLRRYAVGPDGIQVWEGQSGFDRIEAASIAEKAAIAELTDPEAIEAAKEARQNKVYSRGLLLGAGAAQSGFGKAPRYDFEWTKFKKQSESMLEVVWEFKRTQLTLEMGEDYDGKITEIDYGVIGLDMEN